jgi:hypothetical protein
VRRSCGRLPFQAPARESKDLRVYGSTRSRPTDLKDTMKEIYSGREWLDGFRIITQRGQTYFGPSWDGPAHLKKKRGFLGRNGLLEKVFKLLPSGKSNRQISRESGVRYELVGEIRRFLKGLGFDPDCPCGRKASHRASCKERKRIVIDSSDKCIHCGGSGLIVRNYGRQAFR